MGTLEQYWRKAAAGINKAFGLQAPPPHRLEELERNILNLTAENKTLSGRLERIRADSERHRSNEIRKIEALEQAHRESETARIADTDRLAELMQLLAGVDTGCRQERDQVKTLEASLGETLNRLETRNNQLKFLQDSAREQLDAFKTALAEASSRLETSDNELMHMQESAHERTVALEASLSRASDQLAVTDSEIRELRDRVAEQAQQHEASLASTTAQLDASNNWIEALEGTIQVEHSLQQNMVRDVMARLQKQDQRLHRIIMIAVLTLMLVAGAGAILLWFMGQGA